MPAAVSVLNGRYAELTVQAAVVVLCFEWELTVETDTVESVAHGEVWKLPLALDSGWRIRARGYVVPGAPTHYIKTYYGITGLLTIRLFSGSAAIGTEIWEGSGYVVRGNISAPMALMEQEIEFIGYGVPATGI